MTYISTRQASEKWNISQRRIQVLCAHGRIPNAVCKNRVWAIPSNAAKPSDTRLSGAKHRRPEPSAQKIHAELKKMALRRYESLKRLGLKFEQAKRAAVSLFAAEAVCLTVGDKERDMLALAGSIQDLFGFEDVLSKLDPKKLVFPETGLEQIVPFADDALSWVYQYINKNGPDGALASTQFFTERYMISYLVDQLHLEQSDGAIVDPACGGGNFLLYAYEKLCACADADQTCCSDRLDRLSGYDLDPDLAAVASINLRLKAISLMKRHGGTPTVETFFSLVPNIYSSQKAGVAGALDIRPEKQMVRLLGSDQTRTLDQVIKNGRVLITNPPFQTVKGMAEEQKAFLKAAYPLAKCDMCNAFLQMCLSNAADGGVCALVTQTSWMYLDSFAPLREELLKGYTVDRVVELGADAFIDLSGEKANVALVTIRKVRPDRDARIRHYALSALSRKDCVRELDSPEGLDRYLTETAQSEIASAPGGRFSRAGGEGLQRLLDHSEAYGSHAVPMQGTSTGDAKRLVDYYWKHLGDSDWVPVSKGGGYARWQGLNHYCVKWGVSGEYIQATPGSAIRNAAYFPKTQLVFSDTGTTGLNVRILHAGQIFIASGPGIRVNDGLPYAHLAFLNSKIATYFIRLLSPKLTIAAGYIAKLPVKKDILYAPRLAELGRACTDLKSRRLCRHPFNLEFRAACPQDMGETLDAWALNWFLADLESEREQLLAEREIEGLLAQAFALSDQDTAAVESALGPDIFALQGSSAGLQISKLDREISLLLSENCELKRTRPFKNCRGCDCLLEYVALENGVALDALYLFIREHAGEFTAVLRRYRAACLHALTLTVLGFSPMGPAVEEPMELDTFKARLRARYPALCTSEQEILQWLREAFNGFHAKAFLDAPLFFFEAGGRILTKNKG